MQGGTTHHSILRVGDRWFLFYHDAQLSARTHLRSAKAPALTLHANRAVETVGPFLRRNLGGQGPRRADADG